MTKTTNKKKGKEEEKRGKKREKRKKKEKKEREKEEAAGLFEPKENAAHACGRWHAWNSKCIGGCI